jgi:hypothetical protein
VGLGDIVPTTVASRTLVWTEAVAGQIYLAVLIARLVSLQIVHARVPAPAPRVHASRKPHGADPSAETSSGADRCDSNAPTSANCKRPLRWEHCPGEAREIGANLTRFTYAKRLTSWAVPWQS